MILIYFNLSFILGAIICYSTGLWVYFKNRYNSINKSWCLLGLSAGTWSLSHFVMSIIQDYRIAWIFCYTLYTSAIIIPSLWMYFVFSITGEVNKRKNELFLSTLMSFLFLLILPNKLFIRDVVQKLTFNYYDDAGPLCLLFVLFLTLSSIYSLYRLILFTSKQNGVKSLQLKYVASAAVSGFLGGGSTFFLAFNIPFPPYPIILFVFYPFVIAYAIVKYRFMDINIILRKGLVYSILVGFITATYLAFVILMERLLHAFMGYSSLIATILAAFVIALFFNPIKDRIQAFVDKVFFKGTLASIALEKERLEEEVRRSEKLASIGRLAAGIAHEVKNPLTSIKTFTEYLNEKFDDSEFRQKFSRIIGEEVERINHIVEGLLDFAQPKTPKMKLVDIQQIIENVLALLENDLFKYKVEVIKDFQLASPSILADPEQLKQVLLNLFLNSLQAMEDSPTKNLTIATSKIDNYICVKISDTGCGLTPEQRNSIFEPFYSTKEKGVGLGLSIVHSIIQAHSGKIEVSSEVGKGTSFTVLLPINK